MAAATSRTSCWRRRTARPGRASRRIPSLTTSTCSQPSGTNPPWRDLDRGVHEPDVVGRRQPPRVRHQRRRARDERPGGRRLRPGARPPARPRRLGARSRPGRRQHGPEACLTDAGPGLHVRGRVPRSSSRDCRSRRAPSGSARAAGARGRRAAPARSCASTQPQRPRDPIGHAGPPRPRTDRLQRRPRRELGAVHGILVTK
jgi:hypothetical protein